MRLEDEIAQITNRLEKAGFTVKNKNGVLFIDGLNYTISCYRDESLGQWRLTPYDELVQREVREALVKGRQA